MLKGPIGDIGYPGDKGEDGDSQPGYKGELFLKRYV